MPENTHAWALLGAAVVGIVSAATVFIIENIVMERRRKTMNKELANLGSQVSDIRNELKLLQQAKVKERKNRKHTASKLSSTVDDYTTATDIDSSDMEFYDLSDEEDTTLISRSSASDNTLRLREIDALLDQGGEQAYQDVLRKLELMCLDEPDNPELLWRLGKCHHRVYKKITDSKKKEEHINKGLDACEKAMDIKNDIADVHKWFAILIGSRAEFQPIKTRIQDGYMFKKHVDIALELNPNDATLHHLLGRFAYQVASLSWIERKAAATLFSEPPSATYEDAVQHLLKSESLENESGKENKLILAKCYISMGEFKDAIHWLLKADELDTSEDESIDLEVKKLKEKYLSYR